VKWLIISLLFTLAACDTKSQPEPADQVTKHLLQDQQDMLNDAKATAHALELKLKENEEKLNALRDESGN